MLKYNLTAQEHTLPRIEIKKDNLDFINFTHILNAFT